LTSVRLVEKQLRCHSRDRKLYTILQERRLLRFA